MAGRKPGSGAATGLPVIRDGVADAGVRDLLDRSSEKADLAGAELLNVEHLRGEHSDAIDFISRAGPHQADALAFTQHAVDDAQEDDHSEIRIVPAVHQQRLERRIAIAARGRQPVNNAFQHFRYVLSSFRGNENRVRGVEPDHVLDLLLHLVGLGGREVDLVEHRHDFVIVIERLIDVGEGLRFDALRSVHHQQRAFACGKTAVDLIGEIDVTGRVDQVEHIGLAIAGTIVEANRLRLDGDAAFTLDVHGIEHLLHHLAVGERASCLDQAIGERGFAMIDVRNDREIADVFDGRVHV